MTDVNFRLILLRLARTSHTINALQLIVNQLFHGVNKISQAGRLLYLDFGQALRFTWLNSHSRKLIIIANHQINFFRLSLFQLGLGRWQAIFEVLTLLTVIFMPVLGSWKLSLPVLFLWWAGTRRETNPLFGELLLFYLVLAVSSIFAPGSVGVKGLTSFTTGIAMALMIGKTFSKDFNQKLMLFLVCTSPFWLAIGLAQQGAGVPTPPGWLGYDQNMVIGIRSYSLFGNPEHLCSVSFNDVGFGCLSVRYNPRLG